MGEENPKPNKFSTVHLCLDYFGIMYRIFLAWGGISVVEIGAGFLNLLPEQELELMGGGTGLLGVQKLLKWGGLLRKTRDYPLLCRGFKVLII